MDGCDLNVHLISPARSMPFGSERSHFAHSPHLLASLILLIPPEIGGELKRKGQEQELRAGLLLRRVPGDLTDPGRTGALAFPALPSGRAVVGDLQGQSEGGPAGLAGSGRAGSAGEEDWALTTRRVRGRIPRRPRESLGPGFGDHLPPTPRLGAV